MSYIKESPTSLSKAKKIRYISQFLSTRPSWHFYLKFNSYYLFFTFPSFFLRWPYAADGVLESKNFCSPSHPTRFLAALTH